MHCMRFYEQYADGGVGGSTFNQCLTQKKRNDALVLIMALYTLLMGGNETVMVQNLKKNITGSL